MIQKITIICLLLLSSIRVASQTKAAYLSNTNEPWSENSNILALNQVYGADYTHYTYPSAIITDIFIPSRTFIWLEGGDSDTSLMLNVINNNKTLIEDWVRNGGVLLISAATNEISTPYSVGFGITSTQNYITEAVPADENHTFFTKSNYKPILAPSYTGSFIAHNVHAGDGLVPILNSSDGTGAVFAEKEFGNGLVLFSGLTTPFFLTNANWLPKEEMKNMLYAMIDYAKSVASSALTNITQTSADFEYTFLENGVTSYILVPSGSTAPTTEQLVAGVNYSGATVLDNKTVTTTALTPYTFNLTGLTPDTNYDIYAVTVYNEEGSDVYSDINKASFSTLPNDAPVGSEIADQSECVNGSVSGLDITITDVYPGNNTFTVTATSSNTSVVANSDIVITGSDNVRSFAITPVLKAKGTSTITISIEDSLGEIGTQTFDVTFNDDTLPTLTAVTDKEENLDASCNFTIPDYTGLTTAADNCGTVSITQLPIIGTVINGHGTIQTITLIADDGNGNTKSTTFDITLVDKTPPSLSLVQQRVENLDASCNFTIPDYTGLTTATDNCGTVSIIQIPSVGTVISGHGTEETITLIADDGNGNTNTLTFDIKVVDKTSPTVETQDILVQLDVFGSVTITPNDIDNGSTDTCGIENMSLDVTTFSCENIGENTVILTVTDVNGNESKATAVVTVEDLTNPTVATQDITVQLDADGLANITAAQIDNFSTDNCSIATYTIDITSFDCSHIGENMVTLTVVDAYGNESQATAIVTVKDNMPPMAVAVDPFTVQLDEFGNAIFITVEDIDNGSTDNCSIKSITVDKDTFTCEDLGKNTVTLTVTDFSGNSSKATTVITVEDNIAPMFTTKDLTIELDQTGLIRVTPEEFINDSYDNCSISSLSIDRTNFDCANLGVYTITLKVTDFTGNTTTKNATLTLTGLDTDGDLIADSCDDDDDNDGVLDVDDYYPTTKEPLLIPAEAFTPNGDGINDTWVIPGIDNYPNSVVKAYNRWGHEVFAAKSYRNDWEGLYKSNSEKLPSGSYLYVIDLGNGSPLLKGWIFINY